MKKVLNSLNFIVVFAPVLVLIGWQFNIEIFKRPIPASVVMNPVSAICILCSGISLFIWIHETSNRLRTIAYILSVLVFLNAALKLFSIFTGIELGADSYLYTQRILADRSNNTPNAMAPNTALGFLFYGLALLLLATNNIKARKAANYLSVLVLLIGLFSVIGYMYHVKAYYGLLRFYPMAIHTGICFVLLSLLLPLYNNKAGFMVILSANNIAGQVGRLLVPATIALPILLGFIRLYAQWNLPISVELGVSLLVISVIAVFSTLTWYVLVALNKADTMRLTAEKGLKTINENLLDAEERLRLATEGSAAGIWDWEEVGTDKIWWSPRFYELLGYTDREMEVTFAFFESILHPDDVPRNKEALQALTHGNRYAIEYRLKTKSGAFKWFSATGIAKLDKDNKPIRMVGSVIDINEKKEAENVLLEQSALLQIFPDAIITMDMDFIITSWNVAAETLYGVTAENAIEKSIYDIIDIKTSQETRAQRMDILRTGGIARNEVQIVTPAGKKLDIWASSKTVKDTQGKISGLVAVHTDVTLLKLNEERLQLATEGTSAGLWDWMDMDRDDCWWSSRFYELLGFANNEIPASMPALRERVHPDELEPITKRLRAGFSVEPRFETEVRFKTKSGIYKWFLVTGQLSYDADKKPIRIVGSIIDIDQKKRSENALREQSALVQIIPDAIIGMDAQLIITSWNKGAELLYGLDEANAIGVSLYDVGRVMTTEAMRASRLKQVKDLGITKNEVNVVTLAGKKITIVATTKAVYDTKGNMIGAVAIHTDITALKINEERLQLATEGTSAGLWDWIDMNGDEEWWSSRFYELLGFKNNEIPASAKTFREIMHPDDFDKIVKSLNAHFKEKSRFEIEARLRTKSGAYKWFLGTGLVSRNADGVPVRMVGSIIDIDEQKRTRDFTEQQAALINMLPDGIVFYKTGIVVADINAGAEKMFDLKREEVLGKSIEEFISFTLSSGEKFEVALLRLRETGFYRGELDIVNKHTGKKVQVLVSIKKMENAYGGEPLFMAIYTDLTPLRVNEELKHALKSVETNNQYLEQFAYISAHDIKAPIITIAGLTELLDNTSAVKEEHRGILKMLSNSIHQIQRTNHSLNNILKLRKNLLTKENTHDQSVPLQTIIEDVKASLQVEIDGAGAVIKIEMNGLDDTNFNYVYVKSVLYNLLSNAIKYRDDKRALIVKLTALKTKDDKLRFIVEDNGLGFDAVRSKAKMFGIFKRFHTHVDGAGVGLHIVKSIVDEYNGTIDVESEPGKGAKFVIDFNKNILA